MKSKDDLIHRSLQILGILAAGQQPSPEDAEMVRKQIPGKLEELSRRKVVYIPSSADQFDDAMLEWLAILMAQDLAPDSAAQMDASMITLAEARLRAITARSFSGLPARPDYF